MVSVCRSRPGIGQSDCVFFVGALAFAQLRHRWWRWLLLGLGVALVVAVPVTAQGLAKSVAANGATHTIDTFTTAERVVAVNQDTLVPVGTRAQQDARVRAALGELSARPARREMGFRQLDVRGQQFMLGASDELASTVSLTSGRLPTSCAPQHCEAVLVGSGDVPALTKALADLGVDVVGTVRRTDPLLFAGPYDPGALPLVLGGDVDSMSGLQALALFGRHTDWVTDIDSARVVSLGVDGYLRRSADVQTQLARTVGGTTLQQQTTTLQQAATRAEVSTRRFGLLGGIAASLLLGFTVVAAAGLRREWQLLASTLRRRGGTTAQITAITTVAASAIAICAAAVGCAAGAAISALLARTSGLSGADVAASALDSSVLSVVVLTVVSALVTVAVLLWRDESARATWQALNVLAVAALAAAALAAGRGATTLAGNGGDPLVAVLPVLAAFVAAMVAARLWDPAARLAARLLPRGSVAGRIGLLGAIRRPLRPVATVALLTAAVTCIVFAGSYRATLRQAAADSAAYQVPLDVTLTSSTQQPVPSSVVDVDQITREAPGVQTYPVLRTTATTHALPGVATSVPVIGVSGATLARMHDWRRTSGSPVAADDLASRLTPSSLPATAVQTVPAGTRAVRFAQTGGTTDLAVRLVVRTGSGREVSSTMRLEGGDYVADLPAGLGMTEVVAIALDESPEYATHHGHTVGEGVTDIPALTGTLTLGAPRFGGSTTQWSWSAWGGSRGVTPSPQQLQVEYQLTGTPQVVAPDYAQLAARTLRVAVDPQTAAQADGDQLSLSLDGAPPITAQIVAVLPRFATADQTFVIADLSALSTADDLNNPGQSPQEFWLSAPKSAAAALDRVLASPPLADLTVARRGSIQRDLDTDPVAQGSRTLLAVVAFLALAVAVLALVLLVIGERQDGAGELYAWESDGVAPAVLRRTLTVRAVAVAAVAVPIGLLAGLVLTRVGVTLVAVDASGATPIPPLQASFGVLPVLVQLVIGIGAGLALSAATAALMLREREPTPAEAELR
jgi:hypothetical protein